MAVRYIQGFCYLQILYWYNTMQYNKIIYNVCMVSRSAESEVWACR